MKANCITDGSLVWQDRPDPTPRDHEVLIEVAAAGVNAADVMQVRGAYPAPPGSPPDIPGLELAGVVTAVGSMAGRFKPGQKVMALVGGGAHAELAAVDEGSVLPIPEGMELSAAGAFPEAFTTAWDALVLQGGLQAGERVLITGAAGGVGTAAIQLAALAGATVIASCRNPDRLGDLRSLGAAEALDPVTALARGPFDLVLELVGGPGVAQAMAVLDIRGRIAVIGLGAGRSTELDLSLLMSRRARIFGSTLRARSLAEKALVLASVEKHLLPLLQSGKLRVPLAAGFALSHAGDAYSHLVKQGKLGKIVLLREEP
ncbi:MAG: zinc-binding dehydrogenase [Candidatus Dormibacteria bacterium]